MARCFDHWSRRIWRSGAPRRSFKGIPCDGETADHDSGMDVKTCYLCGQRPGDTQDRVPPRSLLSDKAAGQLITVPCCCACQALCSGDDEHFRNDLIVAADPRLFGGVRSRLIVDGGFPIETLPPSNPIQLRST
jgi:hypothetical protein